MLVNNWTQNRRLACQVIRGHSPAATIYSPYFPPQHERQKHPTWRKADLALTWRSAHLAHLAPSATWQHLSDYEDSAIYLITKLRIWKGHGICQVESTTRIARSPTNLGGPGRISDLALQIPRPGDRARSGQVVSK